ncbi:MAG TPA: RagB/SusD family nutrient uptake outer membrane protein, partial [Longimicrobiales bacterium]|nr:RagB/SusD family nutrient uptake outer membrane protein [Longimicrobiales bacterium]
LKATVRAFGGFALVALGEGFCEMALDGGPLMQPKDVLKVAEARFTDAITLGTQASSADIVNMALVGRARVRLDLGDFAGSIADASKVPPGYVKNVTRDESDPRRYNAICEYITCSQGRHASVAPNYRGLTWGGVPDPRVKITTSGRLGFDNATPHYFPADKFTARSNPLLLASYKEAQLFIAEASARTGDLATARKIINAFHTAANIPAYDAAGAETQDQVIAQVIEERRRELFLEGGHRLNDHLRFRGTKWNIPFRGEPGSIHPNAVDHTGVPYGNTTCFALPVVERTGNPNIKT